MIKFKTFPITSEIRNAFGAMRREQATRHKSLMCPLRTESRNAGLLASADTLPSRSCKRRSSRLAMDELKHGRPRIRRKTGRRPWAFQARWHGHIRGTSKSSAFGFRCHRWRKLSSRFKPIRSVLNWTILVRSVRAEHVFAHQLAGPVQAAFNSAGLLAKTLGNLGDGEFLKVAQ